MNRVLVIIGLVILAVGLVYLNQGITKTAPTEDAVEQADRQQSQATADAQTKAMTEQITPKGPSSITPPEITIGDPAKAKHHIQVGWVYDEANLKSPEELAIPLQSIAEFVQNGKGKVSAEIVDLDVPSEDRSPAARSVTDLGIQVDGNYPFTDNLSGTPLTQDQLMETLSSLTRARPPVKK